MHLLDAIPRLLAQSGPVYPADPMSAPAPELPIGALIIGFIIGIGINVLFGLWGKSRAEDHNVHPLTGFMMGFFFLWLGVALVPVFRKDRVVNTSNRPQFAPPQQSSPNPIYTAGTAMSRHAPQGHPPAPPQQGYPQQPMPQQPIPQQAVPQQRGPDMLVADEQGYVECPFCGARSKAGRKACMSCGNTLPPVFDPNVG